MGEREPDGVLIPRPQVTERASHIRGTIIVSSVIRLRAWDREEAYLSSIPPSISEEVRETVANSWVPMEVAIPHYEAVQRALGDEADQIEWGRQGADDLSKAYVVGLIRSLRRKGTITPEEALKGLPPTWNRVFRGSSISARKVGLTRAILTIEGLPLLAVPLFRNSMQGMLEKAFRVTKASLRVTSKQTGPASARFTFRW